MSSEHEEKCQLCEEPMEFIDDNVDNDVYLCTNKGCELSEDYQYVPHEA